MIISVKNFYFCHYFEMRTEMVILYLKEVPTKLSNESDLLINSKILREFFDCLQ